MLDYLTLANKKKVTLKDKDNNEYVQYDLLTHVIDNINILSRDVLIVNEYYVARPDLISLAVYGDDKYGDMICKYNGISNPFEMNEGDIIYLPASSDFPNMFASEIAASDFVDDTTSNNIFNNKIAFQKEKTEKRTPSQQVAGETNYVIDKSLGVVFY